MAEAAAGAGGGGKYGGKDDDDDAQAKSRPALLLADSALGGARHKTPRPPRERPTAGSLVGERLSRDGGEIAITGGSRRRPPRRAPGEPSQALRRS